MIIPIEHQLNDIFCRHLVCVHSSDDMNLQELYFDLITSETRAKHLDWNF